MADVEMTDAAGDAGKGKAVAKTAKTDTAGEGKKKFEVKKVRGSGRSFPQICSCLSLLE